jgi:peptide/nickel transport system ATP-binding protein
MTALLEFEGVSVTVPGPPERTIVNGVTLAVGAGELVGVIGESGAGKSTTARIALGLWPHGARLEGAACWKGRDIVQMSRAELRRFRIASVGAILQDPRSSVNPMHRVEHFMVEAMRANMGFDRSRARARAVELLESVGLDGPRVLSSYPHELSGGMLQRAVIAAALAGEPELLVADEPTTALDVTSQAEVMAILARLRRDRDLAILLVTHNLELAGAVCDRINVMHDGRIVESGPARRLLHDPEHAYTRSLLQATLAVGLREATGR